MTTTAPEQTESRFRTTRTAFALLAMLVLSPATRAQTYDFSAATALLSNNLASYSGGVFVQVFQDDTEIFTFQGGGSVGPDTQLPMASATKWLSSAIVLRLAERGLFQLDDPIGNYLPIFNTYGKGAVTIRQCFAMKSGLYETAIDYETAPMLTLTRSVNQIAINAPIVFTPGTQLAYEGDCMQVVGRICEVVTSKDWRTLAHEELAQPLGLLNTDYLHWPVNPGVPGGARATAADYQKFLRMVLRNGLADDGSLYLTSRTVKEWFTNQTQGLPEYDSPWPPYTYPYGERPDYGHGSWVLAQNPATDQIEEIASPGAYGTFPWVDVKRRLRGVIAMNAFPGFSVTGINDLRVLDALRTEIDAVGVPPQTGPVTPEPMNGFFQVRWSAQSTFTRHDVAVGDPNVSYGSTEFSPNWKYLIWGELAADGTNNMVMWHCEVNPDTGDLIPADGKGFRAFESTGWGRATAGRDAQGVNYVGMNRSGQLVLVRPTSATTGTVTILPTPADVTRRGIYVTDLQEEPGQNGYVFWIKNEKVAGGPGDSRNRWVELRYISLANPFVEVVLQHQDRPVGQGFAPLDVAFPRWFRGRAVLTSGIRDAHGHVQVVEFDVTQGTPKSTPAPRTVTADAVTKSDAFPWTFGNQDILMSGTTDGTGATTIYTRPVGTQIFAPVETITPSTATLTTPVFAQSNERMSFGGLPFTSFQVNSSSGDFFGTTFQETGEIWLSSILQTPQQQWRLSEDSDKAKFENEPYQGRSKVWVFYSSVPKGSSLLKAVINLRRTETPLSTVSTRREAIFGASGG